MLATIPIADVREGGPLRHAIDGGARARALRDDCLSWLKPSARAAIPALDALARRWLRRSRSTYVAEIEAIAATLGFPGIWFLNGSYQWGCTAAARDEGGTPWLARTLDWPFPGLGRGVEIARMRGPAGEFFSVTWPGYSGALTALAPGRFAAAVNQAPLWRRTSAPWLRPFDIAANALRTWGIRFCPPEHLLREVFESCRDFGEAMRRLETVPIARPVIYTLIGCTRGERCVIERTEEGFSSRGEEHRGGQRLAASGAILGGASQFRGAADDLDRRSGGAQPRAAGVIVELAAAVRARRFRLGDPARAQSVHPHGGRDVRGTRNPASGRLRDRGARHVAAHGDAGARARRSARRRRGVSGWQ